MNLTNKQIKVLYRAIEIRDSILTSSAYFGYDIIKKHESMARTECAELYLKYLLKDYDISELEVKTRKDLIED